MKIIIPMTGSGSRFAAAGYKELKPFIKVQGIPIIEWITKGMYPGGEDILFVCRKEHLDTIPDMRQKLMEAAPSAEVFAVGGWVKKGPVYDVLRASECIGDDEPCIINYCDFYMEWDYGKFQKDVSERGCDGCIPCYSGFHPHLMKEKNYYASCLTDENDNLVEIREKFSFEKDKTKAKHSPGVYYFRTGKLMKEYCRRLVESGRALNGEFYASLPYNFMVQDGLEVWVPVNVEKFCQWGTPEDMADYLFWTECMRGGGRCGSGAGLPAPGGVREEARGMNIIMPMAGAGRRFADAGYKTHKPALPTTDRRSGKECPMAVCAAMDLPGAGAGGSNVTFIDRAFHKADGVEDEIRKAFPEASFITAEGLTEGQACTCLLTKEKIDSGEPLLIAGCDCGMAMDEGRFWELAGECDVIVFTYRHNEAVLADPDAYGWVKADESGRITRLSIKKALSGRPLEDHAVVSAFWFKHGRDFVRAAEKMIAEDDRINGEFYVDEAVRHAMGLGLDARVFEVERYLGWGTPKDYEEYMMTVRYWREFVSGAGFLPGRQGE